MNCKMTKKMSASNALLALALATISGPTLSAEYWLKTGTLNVTMPDTVSVPMWGFALCDAGSFAVCAAPTVPGPALVVPVGDTTGLIVHVQNTLSEPVSLVINGQITTMTPVWTDGTSGPRTSPAQRVRSFTQEAAASGGEAVYTWPAVKPGTYLYQSGTHPQVQVQMGLYGAMTSDTAAVTTTTPAEAYVGVPYASAVTMLLSEIDPALHTAVANSTYGTPAGPTSTLNYDPKYYLINGQAFAGSQVPLASPKAGERTLVRFLNAGLRTRVPMISSGYLRLIAEDGNPYPWAGNPRSQYTVMLPAAKTIDAIFVGQTPSGADTKYVISDRRMGLNNAANLDGGMMAYLNAVKVGSPPVITAPAAGSTFNVREGALFNAQVLASDPDLDPLSYSLDTFPFGMSIDSTGLISWIPGSTQIGSSTETIRVTDTTGLFVNSSFNVVVQENHPPVANPDTYTLAQVSPGSTANTATLTIPAAGVLINDTDLDADPLSAVNFSGASTGTVVGNANGSFSFSPAPGFLGAATFTYQASDGLKTSPPATVTVNVTDTAPVAVADTYTMMVNQGGKNDSLKVNAPGVLINDTDPDAGTILSAVNFTALTGMAGSTLHSNSSGKFDFQPPAGAVGTASFTYRASDGLLSSASPATVTITVLANRAPVTVADTATAAKRTSNTYTNVLIPVLANDSDPDTGIDSTNTINPATVTISTGTNHGGTVTVVTSGANTGKISYRPALNYVGTETFSYRVSDTRNLQSVAAQVTVTVGP